MKWDRWDSLAAGGAGLFVGGLCNWSWTVAAVAAGLILMFVGLRGSSWAS